MDIISKLTQQQISEFDNLIKSHRLQFDEMRQRQILAMRTEKSELLSQRHDLERRNLYERQFQERIMIVERHEKEYSETLVLRKSKLEGIKEDEKDEIAEENLKRAEERKVMAESNQIDENDRASMIQKIKDRWQNGRGKGLE